MQDFIKSHYEKIILSSLLVIFVALLIWQVQVVKNVKEKQVEEMINRAEPPTDQREDNFEAEKYSDEAVYGRTELWMDKKHDICSSEPLTFCPFCLNMIPVANIPQNSKDIGTCPRCGKALLAKQKPLVPVVRTTTVVAVNDDPNGNGLADDWEKENGLIPDDADEKFDYMKILKEDPDEDGFTNEQEYVYRTNPQDPKSHPKYIDFTYVKDIRMVKIKYLKFRGVMTKPDLKKPETWILTIQHYQKRRTTRQYRQGDEFVNMNKTYTIEKLLTEGNDLKGIVVRPAGEEKTITCLLDADVYEPDVKITLANAVFPGKTFVTAVGKKVVLGNDLTEKETLAVKSCKEGAGNTGTVTVTVDGKDVVLDSTVKKVRTLMDEAGTANDGEAAPAAKPAAGTGLKAL